MRQAHLKGWAAVIVSAVLLVGCSRSQEAPASRSAAEPGLAVGQVFRGTVDNVDFSLAAAVRLVPINDHIRVCGLARVTAPANVLATAQRSLKDPKASLTLTPKSGGAPIVVRPDFIPVEYVRDTPSSALMQTLSSDLEGGVAGACRTTERLWREDLRNGEFTMQLVPMMPDQRLRQCSVVGALPQACPTEGKGSSPRMINWRVQAPQVVGNTAGDVIETIPTALAHERVTIISVLRTFEDGGQLGVCGAVVLAAPQNAISQLEDFARSRDVEVVIGGDGAKPVRLAPSFMHRYLRVLPGGVMEASELHFPRLQGDCVTVAVPWRSEYLSSATFIRRGDMPDPLYPLAPLAQ